MTIKNILIITIFVLISYFTIQIACAQELKQAIVTAYDSYVPTKAIPEGIKLRGKLEHDGFLNIDSDIEGEELYFYIDGEFLAKAITDSNGFAVVEFHPTGDNHRYLTVKLEYNKKYAAKDDTAIVYAVDPKKPTMIVDIDETVSITDRTDLVLHSSDTKSKPLANSPEILTMLQKHYNIIFLTGREDAFLKKTREWFKLWKFPRLPVFYADFGQTPMLKQGEYKSGVIKAIIDDIEGTAIGIGDKDHDADAYLKNKLKAFIIRDNDDPLPEGAIKVKNWIELKDELIKDENINKKTVK